LDDDNHTGQNLSWLGAIRHFFAGRRRALSEKEILELIDESELEGIINEDEGEMLQSIFEFGDTIVREIMVPRTDMVCCSTEATLQLLVDAILESGHSRIPIFEGTNDRIVGLVYAKDLLRFWGRPMEEVTIRKVMRTPFFVPETKQIEQLLQEFRTRRVHLAIAIDEYGGTSGLVTIEDLLEEIVGDIQDEYDLEEEWLLEEADGSILVDARFSIEELEDHFGVEIAKDKFDTVGGYLFHLTGHVPRVGEEIRDQGLIMTVTEGDDRKITQIRIHRADPIPLRPED